MGIILDMVTLYYCDTVIFSNLRYVMPIIIEFG